LRVHAEIVANELIDCRDSSLANRLRWAEGEGPNSLTGNNCHSKLAGLNARHCYCEREQREKNRHGDNDKFNARRSALGNVHPATLSNVAMHVPQISTGNS
jgi:hypothetical protein